MRAIRVLLLLFCCASPALATEQIFNPVAPATSCTSSQATTQLAVNLNGTDATDNIALPSPPWPANGTFTIQIGSEGMTINSCQNGVCSATRNEYGGEATHAVNDYICGGMLSSRAVNQIKADLSAARIGFSISGTPSPSQVFPVQCADNITFPGNFTGAAPSAQSVASCGTAPNETDTYNVTVGPNMPSVVACYGGVASGGSTTNDVVTFTNVTVSNGQSLVLFGKGPTSGAQVTDTASPTNTYTQSTISSDGCVQLNYDLTPTIGTYNVIVSAPGPANNNGAILCKVTNLGAIDATNGIAYTPNSPAFTGIATPRTLNEIYLAEYYTEATSPSLTGSSTNYAGTGTPTDIALGTLGTVTSNAAIALGAVQENGVTASQAGFTRPYTGTGSLNYCGGIVALLGKQVNIGQVTLTNRCVPTFTTGGPTQVCNAGQRLELDAPATVSGSNIAITLAGHM